MKNLKEYARAGDSFYLCDENGNLYYKKSSRAKPVKLSLFLGHFYNLRLYRGVPVLEIDGLRMQVMKGFESPLGYAEAVVRTLGVKKNQFVLDTCMGLGYTAIAAAEKGAKVVTVEYSEAVLRLAQYNPMGRALFNDKNITVMAGDIAEKIKEFKDGTFHCVIHDPPRMSHAPHLYSIGFYRELKRILKPGARLYHYVGSFGVRRRRNIAAEVSERLARAGFRKIRRLPSLQGLVCVA